MCMFVHHICAVPLVASRGQGNPWKWSKRGCELPCGYCVLNPGPQEEQAELLPTENLPLISPGCPLATFAIFYY